jgi:hypothetical protein
VNPYRDPPPPVDDGRQLAETQRAHRNMRAWRNALVTLTAAASVWPYLHLAVVWPVHATCAALASVCAVEEWRLARALRRLSRP